MTVPTELATDVILPSPYQPRTVFRLDKLQELAASIARLGVKQPLLVRPVGELHELVAGERRLRAARMAGLRVVPVIVETLSDQEAEEICLQENLVRQDLEPMEEARAYGKLKARGMSVDLIASRMSQDPARVSLYLRLLDLRPEYQEYVEKGILPMMQAADLARLPLPEQGMGMRWLTVGMKPNEFARRVSALVEAKTQASMLPPDEETRAAAGRLQEELERVMASLGRCTDKRTLRLAGWVLAGDAALNLQRAELARRSLDHLIEALRKAAARRAVRSESA